MKKQFIALLLALVMVLTAAGCTANAAQNPGSQPGVTAADPAAAAAQTSSSAAGSVTELTEEQAQQIALDHAGFTADQVKRLRVEYEIDDGIPQFNVEFIQGDWEYEYEIHGETGRILSYDKDHKYD